MPKNYQISPVRRADRVRRLPRRRLEPTGARRSGSRSSAPTWRRTPASHARRRRHRPHPRRGLLAGRLQPGRRPADRDRHQADRGHRRSARPRSPGPTSPRCATCCARSASPTSGWSRARCAATPTSRCARTASATRSAPAPRPRTSTRCARVERAVRYEIRRQAALLAAGGTVIQETRHWHEDTGLTTSRPDQGGRRGLPLLPGARPGADRPVARVGRGAARHPAGAPGRAPDAGCRPSGASPTSRCATCVNAGAVDLIEATIAAGADPVGRPQVVDRRAVPARQRARASSSPTCRSPRPRSPSSRRWSTPARSTTSWPARCSTACSPARASPAEVVAGARPGGGLRRRRARCAAVDEAIAAHPDVADKIRERQGRRRPARSSARS